MRGQIQFLYLAFPCCVFCNSFEVWLLWGLRQVAVMLRRKAAELPRLGLVLKRNVWPHNKLAHQNPAWTSLRLLLELDLTINLNNNSYHTHNSLKISVTLYLWVLNLWTLAESKMAKLAGPKIRIWNTGYHLNKLASSVDAIAISEIWKHYCHNHPLTHWPGR